MRRLFSFIFALCLPFCLLSAEPIEVREVAASQVKELVSLTGLDEEGNLLEQTQKHWLRAAGKERWEIEENETLRDQVIEWAEKNKMYEAWRPTQSAYDQGVILGAATFRMKTRLKYLISLWNEGTRFEKISWIVGERKLSPSVEEMYEGCETEADAAKVIWEITNMPAELKKLPVEFIAAPYKKVNDQWVRPNTQDTLTAWQAKIDKPTTALFISNQPHCLYQYGVVHKMFKNSPLVFYDVVGEGCDPESGSRTGAVTLDTMARWIYSQSKAE